MTNKYIAVCITILLAGCNKYLDVTPKGIVIPATTAHYEGLLNSPTLTQTYIPELLYLTDDVNVTTDINNTGTLTNAYLWRPYINAEDQASPAIWGNLYTTIYYTNIIINQVMGATDNSTVAKRQQILGEALVIRANCYLDLLTVFAKAYNAGTAASDPGLPLVTSTDVGDKTPARSSIKATLDTMINNTLQAIPYLSANSINKYRLTVHGAYALLSRIYLYMADYTNAKKYAEMALTAPGYALVNYNNYTSATMPKPAVSTEVLWQRTSSNFTIPFQVLYSNDLRIVYDSNFNFAVHPDLRYRYYTLTYSVGYTRVNNNSTYANFGITLPEMELTRAEVLARSGDFNGAMTIVNNIRKNRILAASYVDLTAANADQALTIVLAERRRELAFGGLRWFDMKRLDQEGKMPTVKRFNLPTATSPTVLLDSLPPHSPKYTFQIPIRVQGFNPDMQTN